ncbi:hypothetical protein LCGC14_0968590 [marine sediment metagenome]|uniref:Uncharacterized protein n=1 Tax=marine sediment metagenome TaxID=412755 RepID=A0A0F9NGT7_9ZZZZ
MRRKKILNRIVELSTTLALMVGSCFLIVLGILGWKQQPLSAEIAPVESWLGPVLIIAGLIAILNTLVSFLRDGRQELKSLVRTLWKSDTSV